MRVPDLVAWGVALPIFALLGVLRRNAARLPDLPDADPAAFPTVCLCVPARDEAAEIGPALDTWLAQAYPALRILVVDDGSTDATPELLAARAAAHPERMRVLRNDRLPPGWMGKNHALDLAARQPEGAAEWLLFVDADVHADPRLLRRTFAFLEAHPADVCTLIFGADAVGFWERLTVPLASAAFLALVPPHRVPDPRHPAFCGIGAFTLVRRAAYEAVGGHAAEPLEAIDDMMLARRLKRAGYVNRLARGGPELHLRMYHGLGEMVRGMRKNAAAFPGWFLLPAILPLLAAGHLAPLWMPMAGHPVLGILVWLLVPALVGDVSQRLTGRPMDLLWALWPLNGLVFMAGGGWAFVDRIRGRNAWRGREVRLGPRRGGITP